MLLNSSFKCLYDKINSKSSVGFWEVEEESESVDIKTHKLVVEIPNKTICCYSNSVVKGMKNTTTDRSSILDDKDCDGIAFAFDDNGNLEILFAELKSTFDIKDLSYATYQMLNSFLKFHSLLSLCEGYHLNDIPISFILACQTYKNDDHEATVKYLVDTSVQQQLNGFEYRILSKLISRNKSCEIRLSDIGQVHKGKNPRAESPQYLLQYPFSNELQNKRVRIYLALSEKFGESECHLVL